MMVSKQRRYFYAEPSYHSNHDQWRKLGISVFTECPVSRTFRRRRAANFRLLADIVDLTVTAAIGVGVLVCFGLVFTML